MCLPTYLPYLPTAYFNTRNMRHDRLASRCNQNVIGRIFLIPNLHTARSFKASDLHVYDHNQQDNLPTEPTYLLSYPITYPATSLPIYLRGRTPSISCTPEFLSRVL